MRMACIKRNIHKSEGKPVTRKRSAKTALVLGLMLITMFALTMFSFAAEGDAAVTTEMLEPVLQGAKDNIAVIVPVGIGLFVIVLGISFIPMIFKKFKKG